MTKNKNNSGKIVVKNNITYVSRMSGDSEYIVRIATFSLVRVGIGYDAVHLKNKQGNQLPKYWLLDFNSGEGNKRVSVDIEVFSEVKKFQMFALTRDGAFTGTAKDLAEWAFYLQSANTTPPIEYYLIKNTYGRWLIGDKDVWIFSNGFYMDKKFHQKTDFFTYEDGKKGIMLELNEGKHIAPTFNEKVKGGTSINELKTIIFDKLGLFFEENKIISYLILGFYSATLRYSDFFEMLKISKFPILNVTGRTSSGKTEFFDLLNNLIGMQEVESGSWQNTSVFINQKSISMNSHFPLVRDEYAENGKDDSRKLEFLRACYNRVPVSKGRSDLSTIELEVRSTLVLLGEASPSDPAVKNRCIKILMGTRDKVDLEKWREIKNSTDQWFKFFLFVANKKINKEKTVIFYKKALKELGKQRESESFALVLTSFFSFFIETEGEEDFEAKSSELINATKNYLEVNLLEESKEADNLKQFFDGVAAILTRQEKKADAVTIDDFIAFEDGFFYIYTQGLYEQLSEPQKRKLLSPESIRNIFKKEYGGFFKQKKIGGKKRNCYCVPLESLPDYVRELEPEMDTDTDQDPSPTQNYYI